MPIKTLETVSKNSRFFLKKFSREDDLDEEDVEARVCL
jgi:hypothetical protein